VFDALIAQWLSTALSQISFSITVDSISGRVGRVQVLTNLTGPGLEAVARRSIHNQSGRTLLNSATGNCAAHPAAPERECVVYWYSIIVTVTSTPQWIRQPKARDCVCKYVLGRSRATQPPNLWLCLLRHFGFLTSPHAIPTRSGCLLTHSGSSADPPPSPTPSHGPISFTYPPHLGFHYVHLL
jgi:hypothetical protein